MADPSVPRCKPSGDSDLIRMEWTNESSSGSTMMTHTNFELLISTRQRPGSRQQDHMRPKGSTASLGAACSSRGESRSKDLYIDELGKDTMDFEWAFIVDTVME
eukprot:scaffold24618_cov135-Amphora_coffeaeformis.AAC.1